MCRAFLVVEILLVSIAQVSAGQQDFVDIPAETLADKIHGGLLGQLLGNLNGLPHELKYLDEPGDVKQYTPGLPQGARTDDDTDIEWVYVVAMEQGNELLLSPQAICGLWKKHINRYIWCANLYARQLMNLGIAPPLTGRLAINPWSEFNISGQFVCETFGLMAPAMPQSASLIALHYTTVTIDGEPAQTTQLFASMIATAFVENDVEAIVAAGLTAVDPASRTKRIVQDVCDAWRRNPADWRKTRQEMKAKYTLRGNTIGDHNGCELNTAATIAALLYGRGDFVETLRLAFCLGWDADNNAATCGAIIGAIRGRQWMADQHWNIRDEYRNITREGMPKDETISRFAARLTTLAHRVIRENGGEQIIKDAKSYIRIRRQSPANVALLPKPLDRMEQLQADWLPRIRNDLSSGDRLKEARAAYLAICLNQVDSLRGSDPQQWQAAVDALKQHRDMLDQIFKAPEPSGQRIKANARAAGLKPPESKPAK